MFLVTFASKIWRWRWEWNISTFSGDNSKAFAVEFSMLLVNSRQNWIPAFVINELYLSHRKCKFKYQNLLNLSHNNYAFWSSRNLVRS